MAWFRIRPAPPTASMLISMIGICLVAFVATGCDYLTDHHKAADEINDQIKRMPGVAHTDMSYHPDNSDLGEFLDEKVTLRDTATPRQVRDIGHTFMSFVQQHGLSHAQGNLTFQLTRPSPLQSTAEFDLPSIDTSRTHAEIDTNIPGWLRTARSPITVGASLNDSDPEQKSPRRSITAFVGPGATHDAMEKLQHSDPALGDASWILAIPTKVQPSVANEPHMFTWNAITPQDNEIAAWLAITALSKPDTAATGDQRTPPGSPMKTSIDVTVDVDAYCEIHNPGGCAADNARAANLADDAQRFGRPVDLRVFMDVGDRDLVDDLIVGGCYHPPPNAPPRSPLTMKLAAKYEKC